MAYSAHGRRLAADLDREFIACHPEVWTAIWWQTNSWHSTFDGWANANRMLDTAHGAPVENILVVNFADWGGGLLFS